MSTTLIHPTPRTPVAAASRQLKSMEIETKELRGQAVVTIRGWVDSRAAYDLETSLHALVDDDNRKIVLELQEVEYISSAGLRAIVATHNALQRLLGELRLCNPSPRVGEILHISGLSSIIPIDLRNEWGVGKI